MTTSQEKKQNFLYDEIIGQGYDAEVFMNFMAEAKDDGTNIDKWTMVELMNIVHEFKSIYSNTGGKEESNNQANDQSNHQSTQPQMTSSQSYNQVSPQQDNHYSAPPQKAPSINQSPVKNEETYLQRYERELKEQQQNEINLSGLQSNYQSQPPQQHQQQPHQQQNQQRSSVQGNIQQQQYNQQQQQPHPNNMPQMNQQQSNSNKKPGQDEDPFSQNFSQPQQNNQPKPSFSQNIAFDPDLARLRKTNDFEFDMGFNANTSNVQNQQYKNNDIWNIPVQPNNGSSNNQNIWNMGTNNTSSNAADPFSSFNTTAHTTQQSSTNANDPFSMFSSPNTNQAQTNNNNNVDPFNNFYSTPTPQQAQRIPSQPPAPVNQTPPTQNISDVDLDNFFFGVGSNTNTKQPQTQTKPVQPSLNVNPAQKQNSNFNATTGAAGAATLAAVGGKAAINSQQQKQNPPTQQQQQKQLPTQANTTQKTAQKDDIASQIKEPKTEKVEEKTHTEKQYKTEKPCKKSLATVVGVKPEVVVSIIEHEIVSGSLFSIGGSSIAIYHVRTQPFNWMVKRKYNDFIWLRNILIKMYPGIPVPPLPGKTMKSLDEKLVQRRKGYFESFLFEILSQPDLKSSKFITDFLSISDEKIFKQRVKETEKIVRPKNLNEIETTTGKITLTKNQECNTHSQQLADYFEQNDQCYEKLKKLSKQLMEGYNVVGNILHQMGDTFSQLHSNVVAYDQKVNASVQVKELEETYKIMNNMCVMQANSFSDQIKIFSNHFYNFFKFHKDNLSGLKEIVKTRNELNTILIKKDANESSVLSGIFRSSKEAVHHPSKILKELDEQVGYYNEQMLQQSRKILDNRAKTYSKHFITYCNLQKSIVTEMGTVWQDISEHFNNVLKNELGKKKIEIMKKVS